MSKVLNFILLSAVIVRAVLIFPGQRIGNSEHCVVNENGDIGTCTKQFECKDTINLSLCDKKYDVPLICCPSASLIPNKSNVDRISEKIQTSSIGYKKCEERYAAIPFIEEDATFGITVVGGTPADPGEFPFMAAIGWTNNKGTLDWNCGGFLIEENFVITAAHCAQRLGIAPSVVRLNTTEINGPRNAKEEISILKIILHPEYKEELDYNDIAIMELAKKVDILPVCLWPNTTFQKGVATATGYGHVSYGGPLSNKLLKVILILSENDECKMHYQPNTKIPKGLQQSQLCAGDPQGEKDTCQGDSGGPLLTEKNLEIGKSPVPYAIGVTSFGQYCAGASPSIYTRVSSYLPWIESIVWPNTV